MTEDEFLKRYAELTGRVVECEVALDDSRGVLNHLEDEYQHATKDECLQLEPELNIARENVTNCEYDLADALEHRDQLMNTQQQQIQAQSQAQAEGRDDSSTNYLASAVEGLRMGTAAIGFMANATINPQPVDVTQLVSSSPPEIARQAEDIAQETSAWSRETGLPADQMQSATARPAAPDQGDQLTKLDERIEEQDSRLREAKELSADPKENAPEIPKPELTAWDIVEASKRASNGPPKDRDDDIPR